MSVCVCLSLFLSAYMSVSLHYNDVIMSTMASQITSLTIVYSTVNSGADQRKHQSSASLAFVWGIHRWPVNSQHKSAVMWKMLPFDDVIMVCQPFWCWIFSEKHDSMFIFYHFCGVCAFECSMKAGRTQFKVTGKHPYLLAGGKYTRAEAF